MEFDPLYQPGNLCFAKSLNVEQVYFAYKFEKKQEIIPF